MPADRCGPDAQDLRGLKLDRGKTSTASSRAGHVTQTPSSVLNHPHEIGVIGGGGLYHTRGSLGAEGGTWRSMFTRASASPG